MFILWESCLVYGDALVYIVLYAIDSSIAQAS